MNANLSSMLRRRRSAGNIVASPPATAAAPPIASSATAAAALSYNNNNGLSTTTPHPPGSSGTGASHRIRLVPHLDSRRSLRFEPIGRDLKEGDPALRIGRFTDRSGLGLAAVNALSTNKLAFRSKVVSRAHAEIWVESGGRFFIRDIKSSSGTFLNHVRLSLANTESRPFSIKDGDIVQLGVDYQGGTEDIYKSVKIRVEIGREWQAAANAFKSVFFSFSSVLLGVDMNIVRQLSRTLDH
jgi:pSer/pThr/pTyr-binding forkhead associated (FHA) protein